MARDHIKKREARRFRDGSREIRELLTEWDPIPGSPSDEYDCLIPQLYALLASGADAAEVERYVTEELRHHFGIEPDPSREHELAIRLTRWAQERPRSLAVLGGIQGTFLNTRPGEADPSSV
jgi:hypothetical protein